MLGLGNDPGSNNSGYTVIDFGKKDWKILEIGMLVSAFGNLTELPKYKPYTKAQKERAKRDKKRLSKKDQPILKPAFSDAFPVFVNAVDQLFNDYKLGFYVAERFQTRGNGGATIEIISMMNGMLAYKCFLHKVKARFIIASQWKNAINKFIDLEDIYAFAKPLGLTPHECDSCGMLLYEASQKGLINLEQALNVWKKKLHAYAK